MPCLRHTSAVPSPFSCSRKIPMICSSLNRLCFIRNVLPTLRTLPKSGGAFGAQVIPSDFPIWGCGHSDGSCDYLKCVTRRMNDGQIIGAFGEWSGAILTLLNGRPPTTVFAPAMMHWGDSAPIGLRAAALTYQRC